MAKLKGPLFSLGASKSIGKALVYFPWKGLNVVRTWVKPSNPKTAAQQTIRDYVTAAVAYIHYLQGLAVDKLTAADIQAYALLASTFATPRTWFNAIVKQWIDQKVDSLSPMVCTGGETHVGVDSLEFNVRPWGVGAAAITEGYFYYGTSKTALINAVLAGWAGNFAQSVVPGLVTGTKYYWQFRPTLPAYYLGARSGIYYGVPT